MVSVADKCHDRNLHDLAKLSERFRKHSRCSAKRIAGLRIHNRDVPVFEHLLQLLHEDDIVREFALADAAHVPKKLLPADETVNRDNIIGAAREDGLRQNLEIQKGIMIAKHQIRRLEPFRAGFRNLRPVFKDVRRTQDIRQRPQVPFRPYRRLAHIESREVFAVHKILLL